MISFAIHAPDEDTFWQSWIDAGICTAPHQYTSDYEDCVQVHDWGSGRVPTWGTDGEGKPIITGHKQGWFANAYVTGNVERAMVAGKPQHDENGTLLDVMERTWALLVFSLTWQDRDQVTNFPAGYRNEAGICYTDTRNILTPYNVRA